MGLSLLVSVDRGRGVSTAVADPGFEEGGFSILVLGMVRANFKIILISISLAQTPGPVMTTKPKATFRVDIPRGRKRHFVTWI